MDLPLLEMSEISAATDDFSMKKKIGEGGFGPVYKASFQDEIIKQLTTYETDIHLYVLRNHTCAGKIGK